MQQCLCVEGEEKVEGGEGGREGREGREKGGKGIEKQGN